MTVFEQAMTRMHRRLEAACGAPEGEFGGALFAEVTWTWNELGHAMVGDLLDDEDREHAMKLFPQMAVGVAHSVLAQDGDARPALGTLIQVFVAGVFYGQAMRDNNGGT